MEGSALSPEPSSVQLSALTKNGETVTCRIYNASDESVEARIALGPPLAEKAARVVGLLGEEHQQLEMKQGVISLALKAWEIASIKLY